MGGKVICMGFRELGDESLDSTKPGNFLIACASFKF
jgi:hypothetical protein